MNTQTIFQAGNSHVISISPALLREWDYTHGQQVTMKLDNDKLVIEKITPSKKTALSSSETTSEFKKWLSDVLKEDAEVLDELALR